MSISFLVILCFIKRFIVHCVIFYFIRIKIRIFFVSAITTTSDFVFFIKFVNNFLLTFNSTMTIMSTIHTILIFFYHFTIYLKNYNLLERESFYYQAYFLIFLSNHLIFCLIRLILHFPTQLLVKFCNFALFLSRKWEQNKNIVKK